MTVVRAALLIAIALSLTACGRQYSGGGDDLRATLVRAQAGTVTLSSSNPTAKELQTAVYAIVTAKARKISSLPGTLPQAQIKCHAPFSLKPEAVLACDLTNTVTGKVAEDFAVRVASIENDTYVLQVDSDTYWTYLESKLG